MQALTYHGRKDVRVETVPDPVLAAEDDLILRVTATAICGSDLHLYRGKIPDLHDGDVLGHEFMGVVEEVGSGVTQVRPGDRVVIPFVIACGECFHCRLAEYAACETTNPKGAALNQKGLLPRRRCSDTAICMAAWQADRPNSCACPRRMWAHCASRKAWPTNRFCSCRTFCPPAIRPR